MLVQADVILQETLTEFFAELRQDTTLLDRLFSDRPTEERLEMRDYFADSDIPVKLGYPRNATELPGIFLLLGSLQEVGQTIGGVLAEAENPLRFEEEKGAFFQGLVRIACWSLNANLTVWLQALVFAAVLRVRDDLNEKGLLEQKLGATDFEPLPQWFPDFAFRRDVTFSALMPLSAPLDFLKIKDVQVSAESTPDTATRVVVVRR